MSGLVLKRKTGQGFSLADAEIQVESIGRNQVTIRILAPPDRYPVSRIDDITAQHQRTEASHHEGGN